MWNAAFGNGSDLGSGGGGGGGGGYVPAQDWEFVPCSRLERERERGRGKKSRSPFRTFSSPPTVTQFTERSHSGTVGTSVDRTQEPGTHHSRLKHKFQHLKKRHGQDKEEWIRQKEILLRQVAEIQVGLILTIISHFSTGRYSIHKFYMILLVHYYDFVFVLSVF